MFKYVPTIDKKSLLIIQTLKIDYSLKSGKLYKDNTGGTSDNLLMKPKASQRKQDHNNDETRRRNQVNCTMTTKHISNNKPLQPHAI